MGQFHGSKVEWNTTVCDIRIGYEKHFIRPKVTATCNILNRTPIHSTSHLASIVVYHHLCSQQMMTNGSPLKTVNMGPHSGLCASQQRNDHNSGSSDHSSSTATGKDSRFRKRANQYHPLYGYGYPPSQQPFPGAPLFYHQSPFNMTDCSQPTSSANEGYPRCGPQWQGYDL